MALSRIRLFCSLLGLSTLAGCATDEGTNSIDSGAIASPGGASGPAGGVGGAPVGAASGGAVGTAGGSSAGMIGAAAGGPAGGMTGRPSGAASSGGATGSSGGGSAGAPDAGPAGTMGGGTSGGTGGGTAALTGGGTGGTNCPGLPPVTDYGAMGPFGAAMTEAVDAGSEGCTLFRPASLGMNGFKHPIAVWGNGITTTPSQYRNLLSLFASHGIVTIACNSTNPERPCLNSCIEWLVQQNDTGPMAGMLDTSKEFTIGYSWGGGAAIDTATRPNVKATVSFHGMPPRQNPWAQMHAPLLLFTSTGDTFVSASQYVTPNYEKSGVPTFYATLNESVSHTYVIDRSGGAAKEKGPAIAFMLYFGCNDQNAKKFFFGTDCTLCNAPWTSQKKPSAAWQ